MIRRGFLRRMLGGMAAFIAAPFVSTFGKEKYPPRQFGERFVDTPPVVKTPVADVWNPPSFRLMPDGTRQQGHVHWENDQAVWMPSPPTPAAKDGTDAKSVAKLLMEGNPEAIDLGESSRRRWYETRRMETLDFTTDATSYDEIHQDIVGWRWPQEDHRPMQHPDDDTLYAFRVDKLPFRGSTLIRVTFSDYPKVDHLPVHPMKHAYYLYKEPVV